MSKPLLNPYPAITLISGPKQSEAVLGNLCKIGNTRAIYTELEMLRPSLTIEIQALLWQLEHRSLHLSK
jgi:hypothetical protein